MRQETHKSAYQKDFYKWAKTQVSLLKRGDFSKVDLEHVVEEIKDLGTSQRSALESQMIRLLMHMLKIKYQPEKHTKSWDKSIENARIAIDRILDKNPSLRRELDTIMQKSYSYARRKARVETSLDIEIFPTSCPWTLKKVLESNEK